MAGGKATYLEDAIVNHITGQASYTAPAFVDIALYTVTPSDAGGGTEVSGGSYARKQMANTATTWSAPSSGAWSNDAVITFVTATANWGTVVAFGVFESGTSNLMYWGPISPSKAVDNGDTASFAAGTLVITED